MKVSQKDPPISGDTSLLPSQQRIELAYMPLTMKRTFSAMCGSSRMAASSAPTTAGSACVFTTAGPCTNSKIRPAGAHVDSHWASTDTPCCLNYAAHARGLHADHQQVVHECTHASLHPAPTVHARSLRV